MSGKLLRVIPVVFDNSHEVAQSSLITAFCEFMFIPGYVLLDTVKWERINDRTVRGTLSDNGIEVRGEFHFDEDGGYPPSRSIRSVSCNPRTSRRFVSEERYES